MAGRNPPDTRPSPDPPFSEWVSSGAPNCWADARVSKHSSPYIGHSHSVLSKLGNYYVSREFFQEVDFAQ